jgi:hypothetical protein
MLNTTHVTLRFYYIFPYLIIRRNSRVNKTGVDILVWVCQEERHIYHETGHLFVLMHMVCIVMVTKLTHMIATLIKMTQHMA